MTQAVVRFAKQAFGEGSSDLWVIPLTAKSTKQNKRGFGGSSKLGPGHKLRHVGIHFGLTNMSPLRRKVGPNKLVQTLLDALTDAVSAACVDCFVTEPGALVSLLLKNLCNRRMFLDNETSWDIRKLGGGCKIHK